MSEERLLLISSDAKIVETAKGISESSGFSVKVKKSISAGVKASTDSQIVLIDDPLPDGDCLECLQNLHALNNDILPIVMVESEKRGVGVEALLNNAFFYLMKPLDRREFKAVLKKAVRIKKLTEESRAMYSCTVEEFLRKKLESSLQHIKRVGDIALYDTVISEVEKALLNLALEATNRNQVKTSELLGINRNTVRSKIKKYRINHS